MKSVACKSIVRLVAAGLMIALPATAHTPQQAPHQLYGEGDLKLESGEAINDFSISYVTHGTLNAQKSNAILMVTAISGNHHRLDFMIGPGKALDPGKYFIVCTGAIANGLTTSPSNSKTQPRMSFPKFTIRDMVESQYRLMKEKFGIDHVVAVVGPSMGGMQTLQWGVSHPGYMDALVAIVPLAKTPPWSVAVMEASRKAIMDDPAWKDGNYDAPPEKGIRLWRDIVTLLAARTPDMYTVQFKNGLDVLPWMEQQETAALKAFDANDWIYQSWAYDRHDVGTTPGFGGDTAKALASIKAKTLILTGTKDLLNPDFEPKEMGKNIPDVRMMTISPGTVTGHASAGEFNPADVEFLNRETGAFLDEVTGGKRME
ncbi:alpha/beta fold hydrolase [Bradyrhizobium erythrophlei]|jgi:homoserine O-acetyltransferase|uniref:Homoserine O-acetyltransferase n=1 Tax=Bradyrhizobium erythrophlei TaxID=1437360 RepID=A0A1M5J4W8_9BRAD|nr:alpha/beta fold hydrolase [Bradyrhizobium erythrophlei]SHG35616.1 homoserine O-acetyltransferase [Bradyrhizobium erythrophlei]